MNCFYRAVGKVLSGDPFTRRVLEDYFTIRSKIPDAKAMKCIFTFWTMEFRSVNLCI
jgi:hypothetical protein